MTYRGLWGVVPKHGLLLCKCQAPVLIHATARKPVTRYTCIREVRIPADFEDPREIDRPSREVWTFACELLPGGVLVRKIPRRTECPFRGLQGFPSVPSCVSVIGVSSIPTSFGSRRPWGAQNAHFKKWLVGVYGGAPNHHLLLCKRRPTVPTAAAARKPVPRCTRIRQVRVPTDFEDPLESNRPTHDAWTIACDLIARGVLVHKIRRRLECPCRGLRGFPSVPSCVSVVGLPSIPTCSGFSALGEDYERNPQGNYKFCYHWITAEEGDCPNRARRRSKGGEVTSRQGGATSVDERYNQAVAFWLEYKRNDDGDIVEKEHSIQLVIDPKKDILVLKGVFVQSVGETLRCQHKPGVKVMAATMKVYRMMLRMFHYILFLEQEVDDDAWRYGSSFFQTQEQLLAEFAPQSLTNASWESVSNFLKWLEHVFFLRAEPLTVENYKAQFNEEGPFEAEDMEEVSDSKSFDFEPMQLPEVVPQLVMAIKEAGGKWSALYRLGARPFKKKAKEAIVEHLSVVKPGRRPQDVDAYVVQNLNELYDNKLLEFRAPFYPLDSTPSRDIDWRMPQPPAGGQHPGGGGAGGGDEGDDSGTGVDIAEGKPSGGEGSGRGSGETESGSKESGGKGSGGKGSGGKRRAFGTHESKGYEFRHNDPLLTTVLKCWKSRLTISQSVGGPAAGVLEIGGSEHQCHVTEGAPIDFESKSTATAGEEELPAKTHVVQREELGGRKMMIQDAIELSDSAMVEVQHIESSVDVGIVLPPRNLEHGNASKLSFVLGGALITSHPLRSGKLRRTSAKVFSRSCRSSRILWRYILDARDNLSGFVEEVVLKKKTGRSVADWIEDFYLRHPFVRRFIADNETKFVNQEVLGMLKRLCVPIKLIEPYHPEASVPVERGHRTLKNKIAKLAADHLGSWLRYL
ncbi:hypothetical protein CBR_g25926 [Chara braunii]|uniref:Integrase catalytic domain-containing protein n=1 Tax=Chara braunii TaxID=69332 RepID=A0A388L712_CHABU|nr:hypothetical protein CBR_g25926 [Chara braunii]|eukprot:GBG77993.1 hypothetical protein CBR_g25926 [Chara braunii]